MFSLSSQWDSEKIWDRSAASQGLSPDFLPSFVQQISSVCDVSAGAAEVNKWFRVAVEMELPFQQGCQESNLRAEPD